MISIPSDYKIAQTTGMKKENTMATKTFVAAHDSIEAKMKKVSRNGQFTFLIFFDS